MLTLARLLRGAWCLLDASLSDKGRERREKWLLVLGHGRELGEKKAPGSPMLRRRR